MGVLSGTPNFRFAILIAMAGCILMLISAVFIFAAVSKLRTRSEFEEVLGQVLPKSAGQWVAVAVPVLELLVAIALLNSATQRAAILATIICLVVFTYILLELQRLGVKSCGCFGESTSDIRSGIVRNVILSALAASLLSQPTPISCFSPDLSSILGRFTIVLGAFCLWPCILAMINLRKQTST